ncbi:MAG: A/G-specific adenine glycosylase [Erysipelotrichaceae bacterium]
MENFVIQLQCWYLENSRDLPFRKTREGYSVWVSEIMAQQTRIETMLPYYERWMNRWPTIQSLADAQEGDVLKMWEGLGYYNRARNLHNGAKMLVQEENGEFPTSYAKILKIPGIGPYTAAAIASIVYDEKVAAIDGNVSRVVSRLMKIETEISGVSAQKIVNDKMKDWIDVSIPHVFTQAMMELGALVCTPKSPDCDHCPVSEHCLADRDQTAGRYPIKKAKAKVPTEKYDCFIIQDDVGRIAIVVGSDDGLMAGYYRFPVASQIDCASLKDIERIESQKHVFSHKIWETTYYRAKTEISLEPLLWVSEEELEALPLITAHRKFLKKTRQG